MRHCIHGMLTLGDLAKGSDGQVRAQGSFDYSSLPHYICHPQNTLTAANTM